MGIAERIELIMRQQNLSARELGRRAGLKGSAVSNTIAALKQDPGAVTLRTLMGIAEAANVPLSWLVTGEEVPNASTPASSSRDEAARLARAEGVWEEAIRSVLAEQPSPSESTKPARWWLLRMQMRELDMLEEATRRHEETTREGRAPRTSDDESGERLKVKRKATG
jgi:transcriptional regulator with XRE-family HTH domain